MRGFRVYLNTAKFGPAREESLRTTVLLCYLVLGNLRHGNDIRIKYEKSQIRSHEFELT